MTAQNTFSCYVIGETTLTLQCCEKLLERGHTYFRHNFSQPRHTGLGREQRHTL